MNIVNLETFRGLPPGTVFMKYEPCCFDSLSAKGETWEHDFLLEYITREIEAKSSDEMADKLFEAQETGCSVKMEFNATMRDGCFDEDQLFAVYEKADVIGLIAKLESCLGAYS